MRRIQRRVRDSELPNPSISKSLTFDRKTFLECSKRMKGLVTTLGRQQNLKLEVHPNGGGSCMEKKGTAATSIEVVEPEHDLRATFESECEIETDREDEGDRDSQSDDVVFRNLNLPGARNTSHPTSVDLTVPSAMSVTVSNMYATAPPNGTAKKRKRSRSNDSIWMKPFSHFVSFMSTIGGNVDIASYPPA